jgi:hypothetical protein
VTVPVRGARISTRLSTSLATTIRSRRSSIFWRVAISAAAVSSWNR